MTSTLARIAPTSTVLAFALYVGWGAMQSRSGPLTEHTGRRAVPVTLAHTQATVAPTRDPFRPLPDPVAPEGPERETVETAPEPTVNLAASLKNVFLSATLLRGDSRAALIEGRLYSVGDGLALPGVPDDACVILDIQQDRVTVEGAGQRVELTYAAPDSPSNQRISASPDSIAPSPPPASNRSIPSSPQRPLSNGVLR